MNVFLLNRKEHDMNQPCKFTETICAFATKVGHVIYCGFAMGENKVEFMKKCPKVSKNIRKNVGYYKQH